MLQNVCNNIFIRNMSHPHLEIARLGVHNLNNFSLAQNKQITKCNQFHVTNKSSLSLKNERSKKAFSMIDFKRIRKILNKDDHNNQRAAQYQQMQSWTNLKFVNNSKIVQALPYQNNEIKQISIIGYQDSKSTHDLMDNKFNQLLESNFQNQFQLSRQLQSKFMIIESKLFQPDIIQENFNIHQKLLEEENSFIREQLIQFTEQIEKIKQQNHLLFQANNKLKEQLIQLNQIRQFLQKLIVDNEQRCFQLSVCLEQNSLTISNLKADKDELQQCLYLYQRQNKQIYQHFKKHQQTQEQQFERVTQQKDKQIKIMSDEIIDKYKEINQLNQSLRILNSTLKIIEEKQEFKEKQKQQIQLNKQDFESIIQENKIHLKQANGSKQLCLSLAEAEKLMNIIEEKEELQKLTIKSMQCQQSNRQNIHQQQIFRMNQKLTEYQKYIHQLELSQQQLKIVVKDLQYKIQSSHLIQQKSVSNFSYQSQDEQLQDLLQRCLDQLEHYQVANVFLQQQIFNLRQLIDHEQFYYPPERRNSIS